MGDPIRCRLPDILDKRGLERSWLVAKTGWSKSRISDYCTMRKMMSVPTARVIAKILKVRIEYLYVWEDEQQE